VYQKKIESGQTFCVTQDKQCFFVEKFKVHRGHVFWKYKTACFSGRRTADAIDEWDIRPEDENCMTGQT